jgi:hypothetical protein
VDLGSTDWPLADQTRGWHVSHPDGKVPVCAHCAALRKNEFLAKQAALRAHFTDSVTLSDFPLPIGSMSASATI